MFRQKPGGADHHECALSAGATISGREGPGLAVGSWALSVCLPQRLAVWIPCIAHVQPLELPAVEERLSHAGGVRTEPSCPHTVSLPRLVDLDWRVDIRTSSDSISRMAVPTCLLQMKVHPLSCPLEAKEGQQALGAPVGQQKCQTPSFRISNPINKKNLAPPKCSVYLESICVLT